MARTPFGDSFAFLLAEEIMLSITRKIIEDVNNHLLEKGIKPVFRVATHFEERLCERFDEIVRDFDEQELSKFERTIEKAVEKLPNTGKAETYTHPAFGITIVAKKLGTNCLELVTCYKKEVVVC